MPSSFKMHPKKPTAQSSTSVSGPPRTYSSDQVIKTDEHIERHREVEAGQFSHPPVDETFNRIEDALNDQPGSRAPANPFVPELPPSFGSPHHIDQTYDPSASEPLDVFDDRGLGWAVHQNREEPSFFADRQSQSERPNPFATPFEDIEASSAEDYSFGRPAGHVTTDIDQSDLMDQETDSDEHTYRTIHPDEDDGVVETPNDDVDLQSSDNIDEDLHVPADETRPRRFSRDNGGIVRLLAPYALAGVFLIIGLGFMYVALSPIFKAVFGHHHAQGAYVNVDASNVTPNTPSHTYTTPSPQTTSMTSSSPIPAPPVQSPDKATSSFNPPAPQTTGDATANEVASLKEQIASLQQALAADTNLISSQNAQLQSVEAEAKLAADKNSASIALLENNVLTLQSTMQSMQQSAKPAETAALPVPDSDMDSPDDDQVIPGYDLRGASQTAAVVKSPTDLATYNLGQEIPGAGIAKGWKRWDGTWELVTTEGVIRPAETDK